ncbi:Holliday junction resolvase RecU [Pullulanibacillus camelliae]|uniref:Holliday junction resolvase RecU n=1 Tax=Pullulanibacillus camelliae TaxID=1707096 RepID=A0A8J2YJZ7_9BACL|nr:Holliday junction resolvase RecU [Pullulanibacillus camelliae]GGE47851.1 Holliday junction resolvase RecU [Pullulanibacillus camelliae]
MASYGKRGMTFENLVNYTNKIYSNQKRAVINKRPTPMKIISKTRIGQNICVFDSKSTVDYDGVYKGYSIQFEAKTTKEKRFPLDMITSGQVQFLNSAEYQGAICFVLLEMRVTNSVYLIPNQMLQKYIRDAQNGGRKSIPLDDIEVYAQLVKTGNGAPLDYLTVVDDLISKGVVGCEREGKVTS